MTPEDHFGLCIFFIAFVIVLAAIRLLFDLHKSFAHRAQYVAEALFFLAVCITTANVSVLSYKGWKEIELRRRTQSEVVVELYMFSPYWRRVIYWIGLMYLIELWILKGAFIALYWSFFHRSTSRLRYLLYGTIAYLVGTFVSTIILFFTLCLPINRNWSADITDYYQCSIMQSPLIMSLQCSFNITTDVLILLIPLLFVQQLHLATTEKFALLVVFLVGGVSIVSSSIRFAMILRVVRRHLTAETLREIEMWSVVEFSTAILSYCMPSLRSYVVRFFGREFSRFGKVVVVVETFTKSMRRRAEVRRNFLATDVDVDAYLDGTTLRTEGVELEERGNEGSNSREALWIGPDRTAIS